MDVELAAVPEVGRFTTRSTKKPRSESSEDEAGARQVSWAVARNTHVRMRIVLDAIRRVTTAGQEK